MQDDPILFTIFLVFSGAALLATVALFARQALLIAYILLGALFGPWGFGFVDDPAVVKEIADIGIIFLLFLLGLDLKPQELLNLLRKTTLVTLGSSLLFFVIGFSVAWLFGFSWVESLVVGGTMTFSSTIIGLKLLPTTVLHHQRTGEIIISILLLQDLLAIVMLLLLEGRGVDLASAGGRFILLLLALPVFDPRLLAGGALPFGSANSALQARSRSMCFCSLSAWCLGMAELAGGVGLSREIGAFSAGVALATSPIALYIAESLRPLRDFFLILFFFSPGSWGESGEATRSAAAGVAAGDDSDAGFKPWAFRRLLGAHRRGS